MALGYGGLISGEETKAVEEGRAVDKTRYKVRKRGNELRNILVTRNRSKAEQESCNVLPRFRNVLELIYFFNKKYMD